MITLRQIERSWNSKHYSQMNVELLAARSEDSAKLRSLLTSSLAAAAMGLIRLDELNQSHAPLATSFVRRVLCSQKPDGGWDDPLLTALCIRALLTSRGQGEAIDRGITFLAQLQKSDGTWSATGIHRTEPDAFTSAFIFFSLGLHAAFLETICVDDAIAWFERKLALLDPSSRKLWEIASRKVRSVRARTSGWMLDLEPVSYRSKSFVLKN